MLDRKISSLIFSCLIVSASVSVYAQEVPPPLSKSGGYKLVFQDEFDSLDLSKDGRGEHTWYEGVWFNQKHAPLANISVASSALSLNWTLGQATPDTSITTLSHDNKHFHAWRYGYFEARMKWDVVKGAWPAFWLVPVQDATRADLYNGVRESGEIDILEGQGDHPHNIYTTVHDWVNNKDSANSNNVVKLPSNIDLSQFHTYALLWSPGHLYWYLDGKEVHRENAPAIFDKQDYYIVIGAQEGAKWRSGDLTDVDASTLNLMVDWVRVWQQKN